MKEKVVAAKAAISVPARAGPGGGPVLNPWKTSMETRDSIVITYSRFKSPALFWIADYQHFSKKNGAHFPHYIYGADNNVINEIMVLV